MKKKCFERPPKFGNRVIMMILGVVLQGLGLSVLINLKLGTDPCSCLTQGVTNWLPFSFGTCQLLCHLVTFTFVLKYDVSQIGFGTIGNMVCLGYISDFFRWIWSNVLPNYFFEQKQIAYVLLLPVLLVFCVGVAMYLSAGLGASPYDALPFIIYEHQKKLSFKCIRILWDVAFVIGGFILGGNVGIVTVAVAFFLGPIISWIRKKMEVFLR